MNQVYKPPQSEVIHEENIDFELASPGTRLLASIIDVVLMMAAIIPIGIALGFKEVMFNADREVLESVLYGAATYVTFVIMNGYTLTKSGQTLGKKLLKIRVVSKSGSNASVLRNLLPRYFVYFVPGLVPLFGSVFSILNILFIFRHDSVVIE